MRMIAIVGSRRWVYRSMPCTQKLPPRRGVCDPTVAIGRPRTREDAAYAAQYDMYLSSATSPAMRTPERMADRMTGPRSAPPNAQPITPHTITVSAAYPRNSQRVMQIGRAHV